MYYVIPGLSREEAQIITPRQLARWAGQNVFDDGCEAGRIAAGWGGAWLYSGEDSPPEYISEYGETAWMAPPHRPSDVRRALRALGRLIRGTGRWAATRG